MESKTQTSDQMIHVFAFLVFSSSPPEKIYKKPLRISAITAIAERYRIASEITFAIKLTATSSEALELSQNGSHSHSVCGFAANTCVNQVTSTSKNNTMFLYIQKKN